MNKPVIAIDIDDVLAANAEGFVAFSNERWGTNLKPEDYTEHWAELWQVDMEETERRAVELHDSGVIKEYRHYDEALPVLKKLTDKYKLIAITSRRISIQKLTLDWIDQHYHGIFDSVLFAGIFDNNLSHSRWSMTKGDLFANNNVSYVIDDQLKHCNAAADLGIQAVLFGNYPWNQESDLHSRITRCNTWVEVENYFDGRK